MKNNSHKIDEHFKKYMNEMLRTKDADYTYLRSFLNCEIHDSEGNSYLKLIFQNKSYSTLCNNLIQTTKLMAEHQLNMDERDSDEVKHYIRSNKLLVLKMDNEFVLVADADENKYIKYKSVRVRSINEIKERNNYVSMRGGTRYG